MGVKGLWPLLEPVAKPQRMETMGGKVLAVDASIWLHQFLKAMRDAEGQALKGAHLVGFFRRICKLLFYHIKPIFVFDGGTPVLKRATAAQRKSRRTVMKFNVQKTAEKLLQNRMQLHAMDQLAEVSQNKAHATGSDKKTTPSKKQDDEYQLPEPSSDTWKNNEHDPRMPTEQELRDFIDAHKMDLTDLESSQFQRLPIEMQHEIILDLKLKSRKTSWDRLSKMKEMASTARDFSELQIKNLVYRNNMTEKYSEFTKNAQVVVNPMASKNRMRPSGRVETSRIASERGKHYVLVKNDTSSHYGGWTMKLQQDQGFKISTKKTSVPLVIDLTKEPDPAVQDPVSLVSRALEQQQSLPLDLLNELEQEDSDDEFIPVEPAVLVGTHDKTDSIDDTPLFQSDDNPTHSSHPHSSIQTVQDEFVCRNIQELAHNWSALAPVTFQQAYPDFIHKIQSVCDSSLNQILQEQEDSQLLNIPQEALCYWNSFLVDVVNWKLKESQSSEYRKEEEKERIVEKEFIVNESSAKDGDSSVQNNDIPCASMPALVSKMTTSILHTPQKSTSQLKESSQSGTKRSFGLAFQDSDSEEASPTIKPNIPTSPSLSSIASFKSSLERMSSESWNDVPMDIPSSPSPASPIVLKDSVQDTSELIPLKSPVIKENTSSSMDKEMGSRDGLDLVEDAFIDVETDNSVVKSASPILVSLLEQESPVIQSHQLDTQSHPSDTQSHQQDDLSINRNVPIEPPVNIALIEQESLSSASQPTLSLDEQPSLHSSFSSQQASDNILIPSDNILIPSSSTVHFTRRSSISSVESHKQDTLSDDEEFIDSVDIQGEEAEFERFFSDIAQKGQQETRQELLMEQERLLIQRRREERDAADVSTEMIQEIQELLRLFGLPYMTAPMEAEAQCAALQQQGLVDGIITDDSDVFLFGGSHVYKNMFNQSKYVEWYSTDQLSEIHLDREKLIRLAMLLGSDYTEGIRGVGVVTAIEIVNEWPGELGLTEFKQFWARVNNPLEHVPMDTLSKTRKKIMKLCQRIDIPDSFPDERVTQAYLQPITTTTQLPNQWSTPDLQGIQEYMELKAGWSHKKVDDLLCPVLKAMSHFSTQTRLDQFFTIQTSPAKDRYKSNRIRQVLEQWDSVPDTVIQSRSSRGKSQRARKRGRK